MLKNTFYITLNKNDSKIVTTDITVVQGDLKVNTLNIRIVDGTTNIDYTQVDHATITFSKGDGTVVQGNLVKTTDSFTYSLGNNEIACVGDVVTSVQLLGVDNERLTTARFRFAVVRDLITPTVVQSTNEFPILQKLIEDVKSLGTGGSGTNNYNDLINKPTSAIVDIDDAVNKKHSHTNKTVMDAITQGSMDGWNTVTDKVDKVTGKQLSTEDYTSTEKNKLAGIATGANNYVHPANHPASVITQDGNNRFVTDTDKTLWNTVSDKASAAALAKIAQQIAILETMGGSASPKGTYATVAALTAAYPTGNTNVYVVTADGTWRYWSGSAWVSGGTYQATGIADESISKAMLDSIVKNLVENNGDYIGKIINKHLYNPFIKTKIVIIGTSISAGAGATGYAQGSGATIVGSYKRSSPPASDAFVTLLTTRILALFNKEVRVSIFSPLISVNLGTRDYTANPVHLNFANTTTTGYLKFTMVGTTFKVGVVLASYMGIMDVYSDGVKIGSIDAYNANDSTREDTFSGLTDASHIIEIKTTNTKNASAIGNTVRLRYIKVTKSVEIVNNGCHGIYTNLIRASNWAATLVDSADLVFLELGMNDRSDSGTPDPEYMKNNFRYLINYIQTNGKDFIMMSENPVSVANDTNVANLYKTSDIDMAILQLAKEFNMNYISIYNAFLEYAEAHGVTIDSLLADGLHPNPTGHLIFYKTIMRKCGLPLLRDGL